MDAETIRDLTGIKGSDKPAPVVKEVADGGGYRSEPAQENQV